MKEKNLELERLVFFSDAVIAIAITLLALDLKLDHIPTGHLAFSDLGGAWQKFVAFFLSFLNIAIFWKIHHQFFFHIRKIDSRLLWYNIWWLLFIVVLPFSASLISSYFSDVAAMSVYCLNTLLITLFQNQIWDYVAVRPDFLKENTKEEVIYDYRLSCNVAMANAIISFGISFLSPLAAFLILFTRLPMISLMRLIFKRNKK
jgi:TMEM175 potassium channel family protein